MSGTRHAGTAFLILLVLAIFSVQHSQ